MQGELAAQRPDLRIHILGVGELGYESANSLITEGRTIPWLQDVDGNGDGRSDVWKNKWEVVNDDVVILDARNAKAGTVRLVNYDLADSLNYAALRQLLVDVASQTPPWQNPANRLDVNGDTLITPVGDVLPGVNELNNHYVSDALGRLPYPPVSPKTPPPFLDVNGDGFISAVRDILPIITYLNQQAAGEGEMVHLARPDEQPRIASVFPEYGPTLFDPSSTGSDLSAPMVRRSESPGPAVRPVAPVASAGAAVHVDEKPAATTALVIAAPKGEEPLRWESLCDDLAEDLAPIWFPDIRTDAVH